MSGSRLTGSWSQSPSYAGTDDAGRAVLDLSADGLSIAGTWGRGTSSTNGSYLIWGNGWNMTRVDSTPASSSVVDGAQASAGTSAQLPGLEVEVTDSGTSSATVQVTDLHGSTEGWFVDVLTPPPTPPTTALARVAPGGTGLPTSATVQVPLDSTGIGRIICYRHAVGGRLDAGRTSFVRIGEATGGGGTASGYVLPGKSDGTGTITVDDDLRVYVNGVLTYEDKDGRVTRVAPISIAAAPGDTIRLTVQDTFGACCSMTAVYISDSRGHQALVDPGFDLGCNLPMGNNGIKHDHSFVVPSDW